MHKQALKMEENDVQDRLLTHGESLAHCEVNKLLIGGAANDTETKN